MLCGAAGGIIIVPQVLIISFDEIMYKVVVSMITLTVSVGTEAGKTVDKAGSEITDGTNEIVSV